MIAECSYCGEKFKLFPKLRLERHIVNKHNLENLFALKDAVMELHELLKPHVEVVVHEFGNFGKYLKQENEQAYDRLVGHIDQRIETEKLARLEKGFNKK